MFRLGYERSLSNRATGLICKEEEGHFTVDDGDYDHGFCVVYPGSDDVTWLGFMWSASSPRRGPSED